MYAKDKSFCPGIRGCIIRQSINHVNCAPLEINAFNLLIEKNDKDDTGPSISIITRCADDSSRYDNRDGKVGISRASYCDHVIQESCDSFLMQIYNMFRSLNIKRSTLSECFYRMNF